MRKMVMLSTLTAVILGFGAKAGVAGLRVAPTFNFSVNLQTDGRDSAVLIIYENKSSDPVTDFHIDEIKLNGQHPSERFPITVRFIDSGARRKLTVKYPGTKFTVNDDTTVFLKGGYSQGSRVSNFNLNVPLFPDRFHSGGQNR